MKAEIGKRKEEERKRKQCSQKQQQQNKNDARNDDDDNVSSNSNHGYNFDGEPGGGNLVNRKGVYVPFPAQPFLSSTSGTMSSEEMMLNFPNLLPQPEHITPNGTI